LTTGITTVFFLCKQFRFGLNAPVSAQVQETVSSLLSPHLSNQQAAVAGGRVLFATEYRDALPLGELF
jgi:hypothetical protein